MGSPLRVAKAIVYFRMLRSVGCFCPVKGTQHFVFRHCQCCAHLTERIPNGLPEPVLDLDIKAIVGEFSRELGPLCLEHFRQ
jgi:hypothetical protein